MSEGRGARVVEHESASEMVGTSKIRRETATFDDRRELWCSIIHAYSHKASNLALPKYKKRLTADSERSGQLALTCGHSTDSVPF